MNPSLKEKLIRVAEDLGDVLKAYEHLAVRIFVFGMAVYGLLRAAIR